MTKFKKGDVVLVEVAIVKDSNARGEKKFVTNPLGTSVRVAIPTSNVHPYSLLDTEERMEWTPVEKGLPEVRDGFFHTTVIVTVEGGLCFPLIFNGTKFIDPQKGVEICNVIAWQYLPEPYEPPVKLLESCTDCEFYEEIQIGDRKSEWWEGYCKKYKRAGRGFVYPQDIDGEACHEKTIYHQFWGRGVRKPEVGND